MGEPIGLFVILGSKFWGHLRARNEITVSRPRPISRLPQRAKILTSPKLEGEMLKFGCPVSKIEGCLLEKNVTKVAYNSLARQIFLC